MLGMEVMRDNELVCPAKHQHNALSNHQDAIAPVQFQYSLQLSRRRDYPALHHLPLSMLQRRRQLEYPPCEALHQQIPHLQIP